MSFELPPPSYWQAFEDLCCDLWRRLWSDPDIQKNGRNGQHQVGVDIYGRPEGSNEWAGLQCKLRRYQKPLPEKKIRSEVAKALKFTPPLRKLLIATTAVSDIASEEIARNITEQHGKQGLFSVTIVSWDEIVRHLKDYPELVVKYYPEITNYVATLLVAPQKLTPSSEYQLELDFLRLVYRQAAGNAANLVDMRRVGTELGLSNSEAKRIVQRLIEARLIEHRMSGYRINLTDSGCRRVERDAQAGSTPAKEDVVRLKFK